MNMLINGIIEVWTPAAVVAAIVAGVALGVAIEYVAPPRAWRPTVVLILGVGTLAVAVFWSGQLTEAFITGDPDWGRAVGRAGLQVLFTGCTALAAGLIRWHDHS